MINVISKVPFSFDDTEHVCGLQSFIKKTFQKSLIIYSECKG